MSRTLNYKLHQLKFRSLVNIIIIVVIGVVGTFNILNIAKAQTFDIFDEAAHFDYVDKLQNGTPPIPGEFLSQKTLFMIDCTGSWPSIPKNCSQINRNPANYPAQGFSYESQQPPLAYLPFVVLNASNILDQKQLFDYRLGNIFWYLFCIVLLAFYVLRNKLNSVQTTLLSIPILLSPIALHAFGTINNDAIGLVSGLLFLTFPLFRIANKKIELLSLILFGVFLGLSKAIFLFIPASMILALLISEFTHKNSHKINSFEILKRKVLEVRFEPKKPEIFWSMRKLLIVISVGSISTFVYYIIQEHRSIVPTSKVLSALMGFALTDHIQIRTITSGILSNLHLFGSYSPSNLAQIASLAVIGIMVLAINSELYVNRIYGLTFLVGVVSLAIFWVIFSFYAGHFNFSSPTRYMIAFIPIVSFCIPYLPRILALTLVMPILSLALFAL
jgi:hypothetical protein